MIKHGRTYVTNSGSTHYLKKKIQTAKKKFQVSKTVLISKYTSSLIFILYQIRFIERRHSY